MNKDTKGEFIHYLEVRISDALKALNSDDKKEAAWCLKAALQQIQITRDVIQEPDASPSPASRPRRRRIVAKDSTKV